MSDRSGDTAEDAAARERRAIRETQGGQASDAGAQEAPGEFVTPAGAVRGPDETDEEDGGEREGAT